MSVSVLVSVLIYNDAISGVDCVCVNVGAHVIRAKLLCSSAV